MGLQVAGGRGQATAACALVALQLAAGRTPCFYLLCALGIELMYKAGAGKGRPTREERGCPPPSHQLAQHGDSLRASFSLPFQDL